jgi:hypothetical protein
MNQPWTGMLPVDDTSLFVRDTGGPAVARAVRELEEVRHG